MLCSRNDLYGWVNKYNLRLKRQSHRNKSMITAANNISSITWGVAIYPNLGVNNLKKLVGMLKGFHPCPEVWIDEKKLFGGHDETKCWNFPFIFDDIEKDFDIFREYEDFQLLAEQMMILESNGVLTEDSFM